MKCKGNENIICKIAIIFILITIMLLVISLLIYCQNSNEQPKNILTTIAVPGDNTQIGNAIIKFSQNEIVEGNAISHEPGSENILINEDGIYQISYQINGEQQTVGTFNFNAIILRNNKALDNTLNQSPIIRENTSNRMTLTSIVILRLNNGDIIQLGGLSIEDIIYDRARFDIEKIA